MTAQYDHCIACDFVLTLTGEVEARHDNGGHLARLEFCPNVACLRYGLYTAVGDSGINEPWLSAVLEKQP